MKKQEITKSINRNKVLIILFIIISIIFVFMSYNIVNHIIRFNTHREYLKIPIEKQKIEDWMTLNYLNKHFKINLDEAFWKKISLLDMSKTILEYCNKNKLNCGELIISLDKHKNDN